MKWLRELRYRRDRRMIHARVAVHRALHRWEESEQKWERRNGMKLKARIFKDKDGEYRFRLIAGNNKTIAPSEGYKNEADAEATIRLIEQADEIEIIHEVEGQEKLG